MVKREKRNDKEKTKLWFLGSNEAREGKDITVFTALAKKKAGNLRRWYALSIMSCCDEAEAREGRREGDKPDSRVTSTPSAQTLGGEGPVPSGIYHFNQWKRVWDGGGKKKEQ